MPSLARPIRRIVETFIVSLPLLNQDLLGSILAALYRLALTVRTSAGRVPFLRTRASANIHDAVFDERRCLERVLTAEPGTLEAGHPRSFELLDVSGVDLLQRRVAFVGH